MSNNAQYDDVASPKALMRWVDLWPSRGVQCSGLGWSEDLLPGVSVLLDESGDEALQWLTVLTGQDAPSQGQVVCAGLCSQVHRMTFQAQVFWHNPRLLQRESTQTAQSWVEELVQRWPQWSDAAWQEHVEGFVLQEHMNKPLHQLSAGCLRKLSMAAAMASGAPLTVIEEPVAGLDGNSLRYLSQALDRLGEALAQTTALPRWVIVAHWEPLPGVTWDEVLAAPSLEYAATSIV